MLKVVTSHFSLHSCLGLIELFQVMFLDSKIGSSKLTKTKCGYFKTYGLAPHFLFTFVKRCYFVSLFCAFFWQEPKWGYSKGINWFVNLLAGQYSKDSVHKVSWLVFLATFKCQEPMWCFNLIIERADPRMPDPVVIGWAFYQLEHTLASPGRSQRGSPSHNYQYWFLWSPCTSWDIQSWHGSLGLGYRKVS